MVQAVDTSYVSIAELAALYRQREVSPVEVTQHLLERAVGLQERLHAYITPTPELALAPRLEPIPNLPWGVQRGVPLWQGVWGMCPQPQFSPPLPCKGEGETGGEGFPNAVAPFAS